MDLLEGNFLMVVELTIIILVILYAFLGNFSWQKEVIEKPREKTFKLNAPESPIAEIFHLYKHESEKQWTEWISHQSNEIKFEALKKLIKHINERPEKWGYVTLEVLESLKAFKDQAPESYVARFISLTSSLWRDYKSIPNYYQKALEVLVYLQPDLAYKVCKEEIDKKSNSDISIEKKRIIINLLPDLGDLAADLLTEILSSNQEISGIRYQALRICIKLNDDLKKIIFLETLKSLAEKYKKIKKVPKLDDINFLEDITEESLYFIGDYNFYKAIDELCHNDFLVDRILAPIITRLNKDNSNFTLIEIYALTRLKDTKQSEIKKILGRKNDLEFSEMNNIVSHEFMEEFTEADLQSSEFISEFPIPVNLKDKYKDFKNQINKTIDDFSGRSCEKTSGGLLIYGNSQIQKLYFSRSLAHEKDWNFAFVDFEYYLNNNLYQDFHNLIIGLGKPYLLYLKNPHLLFDADETTVINPNKEKFIRTLNVQGLDSKVIFVGDIPFIFKEIEQTISIKSIIKILCSKFFPNIIEMSLNEEKSKSQLIEDFLKNIKPGRIEKKKELMEELMEAGEDKDPINFAFFVVHVFRIILLVFGRDVAYENVKGLIKQFEETKTNEAPTEQN